MDKMLVIQMKSKLSDVHHVNYVQIDVDQHVNGNFMPTLTAKW